MESSSSGLLRLSVGAERRSVTDGAVLNSNMLLFFFFPGSSPGETFKTEGAAVPVLCRYRRCFTDSQLSGSGSRFLPRVRDDLLHIQLEPFLFHQDRTRSIYITCYLEAVSLS